jgi:ankyrin repeat protein
MWYGDPTSHQHLHLTSVQDERTPLHWAASSGSLDIVRFLIDKKAEVDFVDNSGWTPLHIAGDHTYTFAPFLLKSCPVSAGHDEIVQELVGAGADVNKYRSFSHFFFAIFNNCLGRTLRELPHCMLWISQHRFPLTP